MSFDPNISVDRWAVVVNETPCQPIWGLDLTLIFCVLGPLWRRWRKRLDLDYEADVQIRRRWSRHTNNSPSTPRFTVKVCQGQLPRSEKTTHIRAPWLLENRSPTVYLRIVIWKMVKLTITNCDVADPKCAGLFFLYCWCVGGWRTYGKKKGAAAQQNGDTRIDDYWYQM